MASTAHTAELAAHRHTAATEEHASALPVDVTVRRSDVGLLLLALAVLVGVFYVAGRIVVASSVITSADEAVAEWFVEQRTPAFDTMSLVGSYLAETIVKVVVTAVAAIGMWMAWRRWREPLTVVVPLVLEAMAFITITYLVGRSRPDVARLDESPVGSSFPSGHVAAAAAYGAFAIVVFWQTRDKWVRAVALVLTAMIPLVVGLSRMYRGMHFLSDVIAGALLGLASLAATWYILHRAQLRTERDNPAPEMTEATAAGRRVAVHEGSLPR